MKENPNIMASHPVDDQTKVTTKVTTSYQEDEKSRPSSNEENSNVTPIYGSKSFYLVDSTTKRVSEDAVTLVLVPAQEYEKLISSKNSNDDNSEANPELKWSKIRTNYQDFFSEFFATFILIVIGDGSVAQVILSQDKNGSYVTICWCWGIGVMLGVYVGGKSGGHMNPAVTLANCIYRQFPWRKLPVYALAQTLGAMLASAVIYGNYQQAIDIFEGGRHIRTVPGSSSHATGGIFSTYPTSFLSSTGQFFSEFLATSVLLFCLFALTDHKNLGAGNLLPITLFFLIFGIGASLGWETGFAINPARDLGPRLMSLMLGYPGLAFTISHRYAWVPIIGPLLGAIFGGFLYDVFIYTGESPINTPWWGLKKAGNRQWAGSTV